MAGPKVFNCPNCGAGIFERVQGKSITFVCGSCQAIVDKGNKAAEVVSKAKAAKTHDPAIPLSSRGKLKGTEWEVVGFVVRSDESEKWFWREYLIFNPTRGFRWLVESDGHWNFVTTIHEKPKGRGDTMSVLGKNYQRFVVGKAIVQFVLGEFYWRVRVGETVDAADYVCPPEMLSRESSAGEVIWSIGEYVDAEMVRQAFMVKSAFPSQIGISPNQPSGLSSSLVGLISIWAAFLSVVTLGQCHFVARAKNEQIFRADFVSKAAATPEPTKIVTPSFFASGGESNLELIVEAPVDNSWFELGVDLVNEGTGDSIELEQGVEYYHGRDSDGSWSEGSRSASTLLSRIPDGNYHLILEPKMPTTVVYGGTVPPLELPFTVGVRRDVPMWFNYFLSLVLLSVMPLLVWWRSRSFEVERWSTSDYSPYEGDDD